MLVNITFLYISKAANSVLLKELYDIHVNYSICHSYVDIGVIQKTLKLFARKRQFLLIHL